MLKSKISSRQPKARQNADIRKPEIVRSFYLTILEEGFEGASIAKVARRIKIHPSLILHYFENKENLTLALVDFVIEEYGKLLDRIALLGLSPEDRLLRLLETIWSSEYYGKVHIAASFEILGAGFRNPGIDGKVKTLYREFKAFLVRELDAAVTGGVIADIDRSRGADLILTMIEGSRHFRHCFVKEEGVDTYNADMVSTILAFLRNPPERMR